MGGYSQFAASSQFFLYGKRHFTKTGYIRHSSAYTQPVNFPADLNGKTFLVTGANAGLGKEVVRFLARSGATVYMVCRSLERAEKARGEITEEIPDAQLHILQADCSLQKDVRRIWEEFSATGAKLDGLVCNAGALLESKVVTEEGFETTFAAHLLVGTYLLGKLALPALEAQGGRLVIVSSGGMYNTKFPEWETALGLCGYNGTMAYAYMKRGQVLLAERWAAQHPAVKVVSCHPGWAGTEGVDQAFGSQKSALEPLRSPWEGAEGICWLLACPKEEIASGEFYLDRQPQVKHMAGPFFSEGNFTKNTEAEVDEMVKNLDAYSGGQHPSAQQLWARHQAHDAGQAAVGKLQAMERPVDLQRFMGKWYVIGHIPTFLDKNTANNVETYTWNEEEQRIDVNFTYMDLERTKTSTIEQRAFPINATNSEWKLRLKLGFIPISLPYLILDCDEEYSTCVIGVPDRSVLYIMARERSLDDDVYERLKNFSEAVGYNRSLIKDTPQVWDPVYPEMPEVDCGEIDRKQRNVTSIIAEACR
jgi:dehydrogenase/reductase SDR family protein 12